MKKKLLLFIFILSVFLLPNCVMARTLEEAEDVFDALPIIYDSDGGRASFNVQSIPFETIWENSCDNMTIEEMIERNPWISESGVNLDDALRNTISNCRDEIIYMYFEDYSYGLFDDEYVLFGTYDSDTKEITLSVSYEDADGNSKSKEVVAEAVFVTPNENILKKANKVTEELDYYYSMSGLDSLSSFYHYGYVLETDTKPLAAIHRISELKKVIRKNDEFYFSVPTSGGGSTPYFAGMSGTINIYKDNVLYASKQATFEFNTIIAVDKNDTGTVFEKAEKRFKNFFKNKVNVSVDTENFVEYKDDMMLNDACNATFGTEDLEYVAYYTAVTIGEDEYNIAIVEVDSKLLDKYEVTAKHNTTDIHFYTNGYEVPMDAGVDAHDKKDSVDKIFDKKKIKLLSAYNIDVVKGDGTLVNYIDDGIDVFIPVQGVKVGDKMKVYHIDNEDLGDEFVGEVVEIDGKQYVKFRTTHFSTYAVAESVAEVANPNTGDNIIYTFIFVLLSISGLVAVYKLKPKFN